LKTGGRWADTTVELPLGQWHNEFTDEAFNDGDVRVASLLKRFSVALLTREDQSL
jgi:maltooligosyltrehalose synthase